MKKLAIYIGVALITGFLTTSCDKLSAPYATVKTGGTTDSTSRKVLLEDYTGQKCVNCPEAAISARVMAEASGGRIIIMSVHAGFFADSSATGDFTANYTTAAGNQWNTDFGVTGNPKGMVDRTLFGGERVLGPDMWLDATTELLALPPDALISITNSYNATSRELSTTVKSRFLKLLSGKYNVSVCILEDSIISPQKNNNPAVGPVPIIYDYVFMDVLRNAINGNYGEEITASVDTNMVYEKSYTYTLKSNWVPKNCHVLAFVFNAETFEVVQVEDKFIIPKSK
jgi:hypothetical protein